MSKSKNILVGLTGSIACYKTCELISSLVKAGYTVQVVASKAALQFVGESTLEGLTGRQAHLAGSGSTWFVEGSAEELGLADGQGPAAQAGEESAVLVSVRTMPPLV